MSNHWSTSRPLSIKTKFCSITFVHSFHQMLTILVTLFNKHHLYVLKNNEFDRDSSWYLFITIDRSDYANISYRTIPISHIFMHRIIQYPCNNHEGEEMRARKLLTDFRSKSKQIVTEMVATPMATRALSVAQLTRVISKILRCRLCC